MLVLVGWGRNGLRCRPLDVGEPAVQVAGRTGERFRDQVLEAVQAVHQELPLSAAFSQDVPLIGNNHIQHFLQLILVRKLHNTAMN